MLRSGIRYSTRISHYFSEIYYMMMFTPPQDNRTILVYHATIINSKNNIHTTQCSFDRATENKDCVCTLQPQLQQQLQS